MEVTSGEKVYIKKCLRFLILFFRAVQGFSILVDYILPPASLCTVLNHYFFLGNRRG